MADSWNPTPYDFLPDVRDGLSRVDRIVLYELCRAQQELGREWIPSALLYGRVVEHVNITPEQLQAILRRFGAGQRVND